MRQDGTKKSALWGKGGSRFGRTLVATVTLVALAAPGAFLDLSWLANWTW